jgi:hypothetical protein
VRASSLDRATTYKNITGAGDGRCARFYCPFSVCAAVHSAPTRVSVSTFDRLMLDEEWSPVARSG